MLQYQLLALLINFWVGSRFLQHAQNFSEYSFPSFVHISLLARVNCKELLACFEASGFCYIIDNGPSLGLVLVITLLPCIVGILRPWILQHWPLHMLQQILDGLDVGVGQLITLGLGSCRTGQSTSSPLSSPLECAGPWFLPGTQGELPQACVWFSLFFSVLNGTVQGHASSSVPEADCPGMHVCFLVPFSP